MRLVAGLCPDPLRGLTSFPRPPAKLSGGEGGEWKGGGRGKRAGKVGKGRIPPVSEVH